MRGMRVGLVAALLFLAVPLQMSLLSRLAIAGVSCDLVLILVLGFGLARGPEFGALAGFAGGLLLDVVPPADHAAGRWALALALAGYIAGAARRDVPLGPWVVALTTVLGVSVALGVFAATGSLLRDPSVDWGSFVPRLGIAVGYDVLVAVLVVPAVTWLLGLLEPARERSESLL